MDRATAMLAGAGFGAALMYFLDPDVGRRHRTQVRDRALQFTHQAQEAADMVRRDASQRVEGVRAGDFSALVGGKEALRHPFEGSWSPSGRAMLVGVGSGMFLYGLTEEFPLACILGTIGLALVAEGATNASLSDIQGAAGTVVERARGVADAVRGQAPQMA